MSFWLYLGDCVEVMKSWPGASFDSLVTDPPAGIKFSNRSWDSDKGGRDKWIAWLAQVSGQMLRLLKPGAWGLVWALPRTSHWTAMGLEDGGFEIRDIKHHLFGSGFPKSTDRATIPAEWEGWNTALTPAAEHWILVRKPADGTLAENLQTYGCGAMNVDGCRIDPGRWPKNVILSEEVAVELDEQAGHREPNGTIGPNTAAAAAARGIGVAFGPHIAARGPWESYGDSGGVSRYFYVAKPSRAEREAGCDYLPFKTAGETTGRVDGSAGLKNPRAGAGRTSGARNHHPTCKSITLMQYLVRLVTPPGGVVLDPFCGSGTTGIAALKEGFRFVGIDLQADHLAIANARITHHSKGEP